MQYPNKHCTLYRSRGTSKTQTVFFGLLKLRKTSVDEGWTPTSVLPCSLTRHTGCPPSLPKSISPSVLSCLPLCPCFPHVDPETDKCCYSIIPDSPFSLFFSPFIPPSLPPPAFLSRSSSVSVLRPALITHNPPHPLRPLDDVWAAFSPALS